MCSETQRPTITEALSVSFFIYISGGGSVFYVGDFTEG